MSVVLFFCFFGFWIHKASAKYRNGSLPLSVLKENCKKNCLTFFPISNEKSVEKKFLQTSSTRRVD